MKLMLTNSYSVNVIGHTWEGFESTYTYSGFNAIPNAQEVKRKAGDFESICDYQIISFASRVVRKGNKTTETRVTLIVRDWQNEDSEEKFELSQMN